jgi:hypothetical protein
MADFDTVLKLVMGLAYTFSVTTMMNPGEYFKNAVISMAMMLFIAVSCGDVRIEGLDFLDPAILMPQQKVPQRRTISRIVVHYSDGTLETSYPSTVPQEWVGNDYQEDMQSYSGSLLPLY